MSSACNYYRVVIYYETWANDADEAMENADIVLGGSIKSAKFIEVWNVGDECGPEKSYTHPLIKK